MRRLMLQNEPGRAGLRPRDIQQVQKYEKGVNRISVGRLQQIAQLFQVPVPFFFEGTPGGIDVASATPTGVNEVLATSDGLALAKAFTPAHLPG
jgi:transcriptional regulator with XRE-family HTH domain